MAHRSCFIAVFCLAAFSLGTALTELLGAQALPSIKNAVGLELVVARENAQPMLRLVLPGQAESNHAIQVLFPEHVTARRHGSIDPVQLYMFRFGPQHEQPTWRRGGNYLEYERELPAAVHL